MMIMPYEIISIIPSITMHAHVHFLMTGSFWVVVNIVAADALNNMVSIVTANALMLKH